MYQQKSLQNYSTTNAANYAFKREKHMDIVGIDHVTNKFERDFLKKNQTEFENWFVEIARFAYGSDFQPVSNHGKYGDYKCDGYRQSTQTVFQCYAPITMKEKKLIEKIETDFKGALEYWKGNIKEWILVHNKARGLSPNALQFILDLRKQFESMKIEIWSDKELLDIVLNLSESNLTSLFGPILTHESFSTLTLKDIEPVIEAIEKSEPTVDLKDIIEPSVDKLKKNDISKAARNMLNIGRQKSALVEDLLMRFDTPDRSEKIAESIRKRYIKLKKPNSSSEKIFHLLQDYIGFAHQNNTPTRFSAIWTILAYFFDKCDIFENPSDVDHENDTSNQTH